MAGWHPYPWYCCGLQGTCRNGHRLEPIPIPVVSPVVFHQGPPPPRVATPERPWWSGRLMPPGGPARNGLPMYPDKPLPEARSGERDGELAQTLRMFKADAKDRRLPFEGEHSYTAQYGLDADESHFGPIRAKRRRERQKRELPLASQAGRADLTGAVHDPGHGRLRTVAYGEGHGREFGQLFGNAIQRVKVRITESGATAPEGSVAPPRRVTALERPLTPDKALALFGFADLMANPTEFCRRWGIDAKTRRRYYYEARALLVATEDYANLSPADRAAFEARFPAKLPIGRTKTRQNGVYGGRGGSPPARPPDPVPPPSDESVA